MIIVGAGKAAAEMAQAAEAFYAPDVKLCGVVVAPHGTSAARLLRIELHTGCHPLPDAASVRATGKLMQQVKRATARDTVLMLISGGGSSLLGAPVTGLRLADNRRIFSQLLNSGADIREINIVRRHLCAALGGRLAAMCAAPMRALIMSDVVGDRPADIASGPCTPDPSTCRDALAVLRKWNIRCSPELLSALKSGSLETPKRLPVGAENIVISGAARALQAGENILRQGGVRHIVNLGARAGSTQYLARVHHRAVQTVMRNKSPRPAAIISGGEGAAKVRKPDGQGGRNTDFALRLWRLAPPQARILSCDTDGIDGNQSAAGALFGEAERKKAAQAGLSPDAFLRQSDSGSFFARVNARVQTGPTQVNVSDYRAILLP